MGKFLPVGGLLSIISLVLLMCVMIITIIMNTRIGSKLEHANTPEEIDLFSEKLSVMLSKSRKITYFFLVLFLVGFLIP